MNKYHGALEKEIELSILQSILLNAGTKKSKVQNFVNEFLGLFNDKSKIYVSNNNKFITVRCENRIGVAACNLSTLRYVKNQTFIDENNKLICEDIQYKRNADKFNVDRGITIAAFRMMRLQ